MAVEYLVESFRAGQSPYLHRFIEVRLKAGSWRREGGVIVTVLCGDAEAVRFETQTGTPAWPPGASIVVSGICRGTVRDRMIRCNDPRMDWYVLVESCSISQINP